MSAESERNEERAAWRAVPYVLALLLIAVGFTQLHRYNVTWDEALGDLFFGQRYLSYLTSFDAKYLDFEHDPYPAGHVPNLMPSTFAGKPWEYWPTANVMAAATSKIVSGTLHLVDPFDGFHAFNLFAAALLLVVLYRFVEREVSTSAAMATVLMLFLMPRVWCDLMANIKDFPELVFFSVGVIAFYAAYERGSFAGIAGAGLIWGLALGTKANAWFFPPIVILYIALRGLGPWRRREWALIGSIAAATVAGLAIMFVFWPYLWPEPLTRFVYNFSYVSERAGSTVATLSPWLALFATTPPIVILLFFAGLLVVLRGAIRRRPFDLLLVVWLGVIAGRLPFIANFDGVRHFLEIFAPIAVIAAIGVTAIARVAVRTLSAVRTVRVAICASLFTIAVVGTAYPTVMTHPFQITYWNAFVGGLKGAQQRDIPQACDYWATSYRDGLAWLNANAPRGSVLFVPISGHTVRLVAPQRLRSDIRLLDYPTGGGPAAAQRRLSEIRHVSARVPLFVMFVPRRDWSTELDADCMARLRPVREWKIDDAPVLLIYRYAPPSS